MSIDKAARYTWGNRLKNPQYQPQMKLASETNQSSYVIDWLNRRRYIDRLRPFCAGVYVNLVSVKSEEVSFQWNFTTQYIFQFLVNQGRKMELIRSPRTTWNSALQHAFRGYQHCDVTRTRVPCHGSLWIIKYGYYLCGNKNHPDEIIFITGVNCI